MGRSASWDMYATGDFVILHAYLSTQSVTEQMTASHSVRYIALRHQCVAWNMSIGQAPSQAASCIAPGREKDRVRLTASV